MNIAKTAAVAVTAVVGLSIFAGCSLDKATEPFKDGPRSGVVNKEESDVIEMPDGFNNLATKCDHGNRVYVTYHGDSPYGSVAVVPNAPDC